MVDFQKNNDFIELKPTDTDAYDNVVSQLLIADETVEECFHTVRDGIVFTNYRIILIDIQGVTGKKRDITSLPYKRIRAFSLETAGVMEFNCRLEILFSGIGKVYFTFTSGTDVESLYRLISEFTLKWFIAIIK